MVKELEKKENQTIKYNMGTPYKMKGSPMKRNFGIGSPLHTDGKEKKEFTTTNVVNADEGYNKMKTNNSTTVSSRLNERYGGTWTKAGTTYRNEQGDSAKDAEANLLKTTAQ